mgnify:CR=1 FL=1
MRVDKCCFTAILFMFFLPWVVVTGLVIGVVNVAVFLVPAYAMKMYKLMVMIVFWRCFCCLDRHKD